jgi:hypothetical protein
VFLGFKYSATAVAIALSGYNGVSQRLVYRNEEIILKRRYRKDKASAI